MSKHTQGPWVYVRTERKIGVRDRSDTQSFGMVSAIAYIDEWDHEEFLHNARLIAQAPRALEALKECIDAIQQLQFDHNTIQGSMALSFAEEVYAAATDGDSHD